MNGDNEMGEEVSEGEKVKEQEALADWLGNTEVMRGRQGCWRVNVQLKSKRKGSNVPSGFLSLVSGDHRPVRELHAASLRNLGSSSWGGRRLCSGPGS